MNTFSSLTLWIVLATIVPGLITTACIYLLCSWVFPAYAITYTPLGNGIGLALLVAIMTITQTLGMLLEKPLIRILPASVRTPSLQDPPQELSIAAGKEYERLHAIASSLREQDDKHGHIQRIIGQFFLSVNSLAAYLLSLMVLITLCILHPEFDTSRVLLFAAALLLLVMLTYAALRFRYRALVISLYTVRQRLVSGQ